MRRCASTFAPTGVRSARLQASELSHRIRRPHTAPYVAIAPLAVAAPAAVPRTPRINGSISEPNCVLALRQNPMRNDFSFYLLVSLIVLILFPFIVVIDVFIADWLTHLLEVYL